MTWTRMLQFLLMALLLYVAYVLRWELLVLLFGLMIAILLDPAVALIQKARIRHWHPSRGLAVSGVALLLLIFVGFVIWLAVPRILSNVHQVQQIWPQRLAHITQMLDAHTPLHLTPQQLQARIHEFIRGHMQVWTMVNVIIAVLTALLAACYFSADKDASLAWLLSLVPERRRSRLEATLRRGSHRTQHWLIGQGMLMLVHGVSSLIAFWALHLKFFYLLALLAGCYNIIPVLGPVLTLITAGLVAAIDSPGKLIGVVIFYLVYHNMENAFINPKIMAHEVRIPPIAVIVALVIGDGLAGIAGMLIAVPVAVLVSVVIKEYVEQRQKA
ncbi:MAG: AI-2E family transporter [Acidobacteriaceae bacterium]